MASAGNSLKKVKQYIREYLDVLQKDGLPIDRVFIFGSHAKKHPGRWSDIDLGVISPRFGKKVDPYEYLWTKRRREDVLRGIEAVGFHPRDFIDEDPMAWEIKNTGIEIWPKKQRKMSRRSVKKRS